MRAWIQSSLFGVPLPERIFPSVSRTNSVLALARPGLRRVGMKKVSVPGMRALACPNALERPKRSTMRLARATSRLSVGSAPRRLFALLMLHFVPQGEQGFGDERRARFASGELVDRSPGRSEEHTSELQSPCNLVCRLLLEKKNIYHTTDIAHTLHS